MRIELRRNDQASRYELLVDATLASMTEFRDDGVRVLFPHTLTLPQFRGRGLAAQVVRFALDDVRAAGRTVVPLCWFVAEFIDGNPEYHELLAA